MSTLNQRKHTQSREVSRMNQRTAFNAEFAEKRTQSFPGRFIFTQRGNTEKEVTHPKGKQGISLCALSGSAISALKEVSTAVLRLKEAL
jgi:hypothetical protein